MRAAKPKPDREPAARLPIARVSVEVPLPHLDRPFDYLVSAADDEAAQPGVRVKVRFAGQLVNGFLLERTDTSPHGGKLAYLDKVVSPERVLDPEVARLARAIADRYAGNLSDVLRLAVPPRHARVEAQATPAPAEAPPAGSPPPAPTSLETGMPAADPQAAGSQLTDPPGTAASPPGPASSDSVPPAAGSDVAAADPPRAKPTPDHSPSASPAGADLSSTGPAGPDLLLAGSPPTGPAGARPPAAAARPAEPAEAAVPSPGPASSGPAARGPEGTEPAPGGPPPTDLRAGDPSSPRPAGPAGAATPPADLVSADPSLTDPAVAGSPSPGQLSADARLTGSASVDSPLTNPASGNPPVTNPAGAGLPSSGRSSAGARSADPAVVSSSSPGLPSVDARLIDARLADPAGAGSSSPGLLSADAQLIDARLTGSVSVDSPLTDAASGNPPLATAASGNPSVTDPAVAGLPSPGLRSVGSVTADQALVGPVTADRAPVGPATADQAPVGPAAADQAPVGPATVGRAPVGPGAGGQAPAGSAAGDRTSARSADDRASIGPAAADRVSASSAVAGSASAGPPSAGLSFAGPGAAGAVASKSVVRLSASVASGSVSPGLASGGESPASDDVTRPDASGPDGSPSAPPAMPGPSGAADAGVPSARAEGRSSGHPADAVGPHRVTTAGGAARSRGTTPASAEAGSGAAGATGSRAHGWGSYPAGPAYLHALEEGRPARAVWSALPGEDWPARIAEAAGATVRGGRGVVVVVADARDLERVDRALTVVLGTGRHVALNAAAGPAERYRRFLAASRHRVPVVVGTRATMFAPVADLGLVVIWDDGDDLHAEPRAPYPHARDVLLTRAQLAGCAALVAGFARTGEGQLLLETGWAKEIVASRDTLRARSPLIAPTGDDPQLARDPGAVTARLPSLAWQAARGALKAGMPVLVQVPRRGYLPSTACAECRTPARCPHCSGPLGLGGSGDVPTCHWCGRAAADYACPSCGGRRLRASVTGAKRTAEELGRAFPGFPVRTSGRDEILDLVPDEAAVIVATPGAEPVAVGGYGAVLLLDSWALLSRADLRAAEETMRRWLSAAALARPGPAGGRVVVVADGSLAPVQALLRWDPGWFAARELAERRELGFPPAARMASVTGRAEAVAEFLDAARLPEDVELLGPVPAADDQERMLLRVSRGRAAALAKALHEAAAVRSVKKSPHPIRIQVDPAELL